MAGVLPALVATTWVQAVASAAMLLVPTLAPQIAAALGVATGLVGLQVSLLYGFAMLTSMQAGVLVRRRGACRTSQYALLLVVCGCVVALASTALALLLTTVLLGLAYGMTNPSAAQLLARFTPPRHRNVVYSIKQTGVPLGGILAALAAPPLAQALGWQAAFLALAVVAGGTTLLLQVRREAWDSDRDPAARGRGLGSLGVLIQRREILWLGMMGFCLAAVQMSLLSFAVAFMVEELLISLVIAGVIMSVVHAAGVIGRIGWGLLADRLGRSLPLLHGLAVAMGILFLAIAFLGSETPRWLVVTVLVAAGATAIGWNGVFLAEVARRSPHAEVGEATGAALVLTYLGVLAGPAMVGLLLALGAGYGSAFLLPAAFSAAAVLSLLGCGRYGRQGPADDNDRAAERP